VCRYLPAIPVAAAATATTTTSAIATATTPAAGPSTTAGTGTTSATALACSHWPRFVYDNRSTKQVPTVASLDCTVGIGIVSDFHEPKTARFTGEAVPHNIDAVHGDTGLLEESFQVLLSGPIGQIPYEKFDH
jgi:hypothetical protein